MLYHINNVSVVGHFSYYIWILLKTIIKYLHWSICKIIQMLYVSRYGCNDNTHEHHVDPMYMHKFTSLFIDRIDINFMGISFHFISSEMWPSGYNGGLVIWTPCGVGDSNPAVDKIFCNVHLFRVPRSLIGSGQMKSSMTFIRGNRCIERER